MKKKHIIIAVVVIIVVVIIAMMLKSRRKYNESKMQQVASTSIPEELQKSIAGFDEGESVTYQGIRYIVTNGAWQKVTV